MKSASYALYAALGFGVGGAVGGLWFSLDKPAFPIVFGIMGAVGGASLGVVLRSWQKAGLLALAEFTGFAIGWLPLAWTLMGLTHRLPLSVTPLSLAFGVLGLLVTGGIQGVIGTVPLLLVIRNRHRAGWLIVAGAAGFALAAQVSWGWAMGLYGSVTVAIWGMVGGAFLGGAFGHLVKSNVDRKEIR
jgi:hypothetical protein